MNAARAYFDRLREALRHADVAGPTLLIDRPRLDANIDRLRAGLAADLQCRIVAKSLPSPDMLDVVLTRLGTRRLMVFNAPMLQACAARFSDADLMLGKPLTAAALWSCIESGCAQGQVQWLIDTPARLAQYDAIAEAAGARLRIALELDVGLRRGGFEPGPDLIAALERLRGSARLELSGLMGYEPHLSKLPRLLGWRDRAKRAAWRRYRTALDAVAEVLGADRLAQLTRNAAGSPTFRLYQDASLANEIAVGSALVKPTDFDLESLVDFEPAAFIATPVLKSAPSRLPGLDRLDFLWRLLSPRRARAFVIHGGNWLADPEFPPGLATNPVFGRSSNQEVFNGPVDLSIEPDDFVFFRPRQSEAVFLQFGDIAVYDGERIASRWRVFPPSA